MKYETWYVVSVPNFGRDQGSVVLGGCRTCLVKVCSDSPVQAERKVEFTSFSIYCVKTRMWTFWCPIPLPYAIIFQMVDRASIDNFVKSRVRSLGQNISLLYLTIDASNRTLNYSSGSKRFCWVNSKSNSKKQCVEVEAKKPCEVGAAMCRSRTKKACAMCRSRSKKLGAMCRSRTKKQF